jgi:hypothetical protein
MTMEYLFVVLIIGIIVYKICRIGDGEWYWFLRELSIPVTFTILLGLVVIALVFIYSFIGK